MKSYWQRLKAKGASPSRKPLGYTLWSGIGAFLGISLLLVPGELMKLSASDSLFLIGSFGASAVLIYGAPAADFSQPRNLVGGHVLSATIGVTIHLCMGEFQILASPIAVALAMVGMQLTRTEHPPGGATALIAVTGGSSIQAQGYAYVISPVLIGSVILLLTALFLNNLSPNRSRHYPRYWW